MARILIIDDSEVDVHAAREVLQREGYTVETLEMLIYLPKRVASDPPDLILLDLSMPALSGLHVASFIRRYQKRPIPIVIYSSQPLETIREKARELSAAGFVQKGGPPEALMGVVKKVLEAGKSPNAQGGSGG